MRLPKFTGRELPREVVERAWEEQIKNYCQDEAKKDGKPLSYYHLGSRTMPNQATDTERRASDNGDREAQILKELVMSVDLCEDLRSGDRYLRKAYEELSRIKARSSV